MTPHKATPEQWKATEKYAHAAIGCYSDSCILELRDRIEALEAATNRRAILGSSPPPAGGLVELVGAAIFHQFEINAGNEAEARAAVQAVAKWFDAIGYGATASILRQELQRHG